MVKWIVIAVLLSALLVLAAAVRPVLVRLGPLRRAAGTLLGHQRHAEALQASVARLQERLTALQERADSMQRRLASAPGRRGD